MVIHHKNLQHFKIELEDREVLNHLKGKDETDLIGRKILFNNPMTG